MDKPKRYTPSREMLQNENIQQAIKVLGAALMLTKTKGLETTFTMVDEFGVNHQYHLDISENKILLPE